MRSLASILLAACTASTSAAPNSMPPSSSGDAESAPAITQRIDAVMKPWSGADTPGCAVAVMQQQKVIHARGYGMADLEHGVPITPETVFDIASISKQFTATAVLLAAADGKLALDDDIRKHVPALPQLGKAPITIRHLLHHTGGLRDYTALLLLGGDGFDGVTTVRETIDALARQRGVEFEPGTKHEYSNTGYFLLGQIVERATGRPLAAYLAEKVGCPDSLVGASTSEFFDAVA